MDEKLKPPCMYGSKCYRKNVQHFHTFSHPHDLNDLPKNDTEKHLRSAKKSKLEEKRDLTNPKKRKLRFKQTTLQFAEEKASQNTKDKETPYNIPKVKNHETKSILDDNKEMNQNSNEEDVSQRSKCLDQPESSKGYNGQNKCSTKTITTNSGWVLINRTIKDFEDNVAESKRAENSCFENTIKNLFLVDMPKCFYSFFDFCKAIDNSEPHKVLEPFKLKLVGPFDVLLGKMNSSIDKDLALCHWRYYYDPPEFQTVLATHSGFHIGYWRDDPKDLPVFLASNDSDKNCVFKCEGENLFGALHNYLEDLKKSNDSFTKIQIKKLQESLYKWATTHNFPLEKSTSKMTARLKKVVTKSFHKLGIVVPVEKKTQLGYRPLLITEANLKKLCNGIMNADSEAEKDSLWESLQQHITAANIANDECDFGMSLELGIDLFCMGSSVFHTSVEHLLSVAYTLLNRSEFEEIIRAHLKRRKSGHSLSVILS